MGVQREPQIILKTASEAIHLEPWRDRK